MPAEYKTGFWKTKLDQNLLSTPFNIQTNWHVITGASCSGKTTLINQLAAEGFHTIPEAARIYFEQEKAKGRKIVEIRKDRPAYTRRIFALMEEQEKKLPADKIAFLDRAVPDVLAHFRFAGIDPNKMLPKCFQHRYASVFLLDRLPYQRDGVRRANDEIADYFETWTLHDYSALGYDIIRVPVIPPEERLAFIIGTLKEKGLL